MEPNTLNPHNWLVEKIAVVGPGIVGMPMAAMLANARICIGTNAPARVVVIQRDSPTSGWKVDAINSGRSPIGGIEPELDEIVRTSVHEGLLSASHNYSTLRDADVILVCVQTDKREMGPDYGPLFDALSNIGRELQKKQSAKRPLVIFESTLAPTTMTTLIKEHFEKYGLKEGDDILLGNSPNRVMPGRLVERVAASDKLIGGLNPITPKLIERLYSKIVAGGKLHLTNSLTAEIVKTLENAYRDVRIAYTTEIVRYCDEHDIDFYQVREKVNDRLAQSDDATRDANTVPSGGLLIPTVGVGGHCLPKDGILLLWRQIESGQDMSSSLILEARRINDASPENTIRMTKNQFGDISGKNVTLMGTAYRFNSEDTRNSPSLVLAQLLLDQGCQVTLHDPFVKPDDQKLLKFQLQDHFTQDTEAAVKSAEILIFCTGHGKYIDKRDQIIKSAPNLKLLIDGCNLYDKSAFSGNGFKYLGIGRGSIEPTENLIDFVYDGFRAMERGVANELNVFIDFVNDRFVFDPFNKVDFREVQRIAGTCVTGCSIVNPHPVEELFGHYGFFPDLVRHAAQNEGKR